MTAEAFENQARACAKLGSPFTAQLLNLIAKNLHQDTPVFAHIRNWPGDVSGSAQSIPLRLAGAFHALVLQQLDKALVAAYPPHETSDDTLWDAVAQAMENHSDFILEWMTSPPQTNEVRRSACLIAIGHWLTQRFDLPIRLSELGASAGLNLTWDQMALDAPWGTVGPADSPLTLQPDWTGPALPDLRPRVTERCAVDLNPLNAASATDQLRLRAYLWADQQDRRLRTDQAIALANNADLQVDKGDAAPWLENRLDAQVDGALHLVYHTIAFQYFPEDTKAQITKAMERAGTRATSSAPLAWFAMEADNTPGSAAMTLRLWPGNLTLDLGRIDFHGRWIDWSPPDV